MPPRTRTATVPIDQIGQSILILRGQRVLLDSDLAALYGVTTKRLNEQVKRNIDRFPEDFMFSLRAPEWDALRSQIATSKVATGFSDLKSQNATANTPRSERGGRRSLPNAFTEHGAIQAANVLNSPRAIEMGIYVVRAFVRFRELLSSNKQLARQFAQLEARLNKKLADHDDAIAAILSAIRELMNPPETKRRGIGFTAKI
jgi:ORF6N domain